MNTKIIAIGALGGSGTRVLAEILIQAGVFMDEDLNGANDNLIFTKLFKNPRWYESSTISQKEIRFGGFKRYMEFNKLDSEDFKALCEAAYNNYLHPSNTDFYYKMSRKLSSEEELHKNDIYALLLWMNYEAKTYVEIYDNIDNKYLNINNRHIFDGLFFHYASLKNVSVATAMQKFFA